MQGQGRVAALVAAAAVACAPATASAASPDVVISEVYGAGGNSGAVYASDYVELVNRGSSPVSVHGWSVQYASATGSGTFANNPVVALPDRTLHPSRHLLIKLAGGAAGDQLPPADAEGTTNMSATSGKVVLVTSTAGLACNGGSAPCSAAQRAQVRDLVGYGGANFFEGSAPAPALSATTAAQRKDHGARDTDDNAADFEAVRPSPRSSQDDPPPPPPPTGCDAPVTHQVAQVQGSGAASPLAGQQVRVEGVVTGDFQRTDQLRGFFVQDDTPDGDPATSDGLFVFSTTPVDAGDRVRVSGTATEFNGLTQLSPVSAVDVCGTGSVAPAAVDLPRPSGVSFEPHEGVLVTFPEALTATEHFQLGRFGEITVASDGRLLQPTNVVRPGPEAAGLLDLADRRRLLVDDGSNVQNPATVPFVSPEHAVRIGDTATGVTGVLSFGFNRFRLQPTEPITFARTNPRPAAAPAVGGDVRVAAFNTLNWFTTLGADDPDARGADTAEEQQRQLAKLVAAITGLDADVVGLMEVENNGTTAIARLVEALNEATAPGTYAYVADPALNPPNDFGGRFGTDAIKVALIFRPAAVSPVGEARSTADPVFDRPPLVQTFERAGGSEPFTVAVNHFKSKNCGGATGADLDQGDGQSCFNARRVAQASALAELLDTLGVPRTLVLGDLNAYAREDPVVVLEEAGLHDLGERFLAEEDRHSYVFDGFSGELDHALATGALAGDVTGAGIWHINADEPLVLDYNTEFNPPSLFRPDAYRSSDHDPVLVGLDLCDTTKPELAVAVTPETLFPPDHRHRRVAAEVTASDDSGTPPAVVLESVTSSEPDDAPGGTDGVTTGDVVVVDDRTFELRAERDARGSGRTYTITYRAEDACGNVARASATVTVPGPGAPPSAAGA